MVLALQAPGSSFGGQLQPYSPRGTGRGRVRLPRRDGGPIRLFASRCAGGFVHLRIIRLAGQLSDSLRPEVQQGGKCMLPSTTPRVKRRFSQLVHVPRTPGHPGVPPAECQAGVRRREQLERGNEGGPGPGIGGQWDPRIQRAPRPVITSVSCANPAIPSASLMNDLTGHGP
jgi:hypothetical protein